MTYIDENEKNEGGLRTQSRIKNNLPDKPLITVVTVVFNGGQFLEKTIQSVINQSYDNVEYIIIDGGSTDGTLDIIHKYEYAIDYWVSEKDNGIYDAMNKGIERATGQWINFMNAGDKFLDLGTLDQIKLPSKSKKIFSGNVKYESGKIFEALTGSIYLKNNIHHQATFYPLSVFELHGLYSEKFKILADYEHNLKCFKNNIEFIELKQYIAICSDYGVSDVPKWKNYKEEIQIRCSYLDSKVLCVLLGCYSFMRFLAKRVSRWI